MISKIRQYRAYEDVQLVTLLVEGDRLAFDEVYERYWKRLYNDTYKRLKSIEMIEEIVQDVFSNLWTSRGKRNIQNIYPYLLTSVRYQVFMLYRKGKATPEFEEPLEHMVLSTLQADSLFNEKELKGCISIWMSLQPDKRRAVFQMKYVDEKSTREISEILGISQKTVQNQLLTSFSSLRDFLSKAMIILTVWPR
ncbi:RNA polymerase sigma factor [Pedobacter hartonius]|uniref:RNA polymerase sigma-70 factor, ECF subfamily n=1 Tax=Pedobacter hartonius TaxID=425514 RepID=A0A1H4AJM1_9SPHI|nr:sigma-70 family RNA polymerase sigma factor [Pedobacter hartonius]SEA35968.1 RNA polymerase sigma-70 factor, ECF subfamily [Pedobacter hartonius]